MTSLILAIRSGRRSLIPWLAAVGLAVATPAWGQATGSAARLQSLVNDAAAQLRLSYRQDPAERELRRDVLGRAIAAWNKSSRNDADNQLLADWLRESMRASMPGSHETLPPIPEFQRPTPPAERSTPVASPPGSTRNPRPAIAAPPSSNPESSTSDVLPHANASVNSEQHAESGASVDEKAHREAFPTFESLQPSAATEHAAEKSSASTAQPSENALHANVEKQPAAIPTPGTDTESDPFRDDPLPTGK